MEGLNLVHRLIIASPNLPMKNIPWKGRGQGQVAVLEFYTLWNISATANARDFKFCTRVGHAKSCLVMSECSLSGRGQGHVSNFCIVDLENFATASLRYTGDIPNSSVVGLFMTPIGQWKRLDRIMVGCTCLLHIAPLLLSNFTTSVCSGLVVQVVFAQLRGNWKDFNWHDASHGPLAIAELLVFYRTRHNFQ